MEILFAIFVRVILPVFVIVAVGYVAGRLMEFDQRTLSRLGLYVLVPCMTFAAMARTTLSLIELGQIIAFYLIATFLLYIPSRIAARLLKLSPTQASAFHIAVLFANVVNVGFPVLLLAYGPAAVERALVFAIMMQIVLQSFGVFLAARGKANFSESMRRVWAMPGLWAMLAGFVLNFARVEIPAFIFDPIKMVGDALVPFLLILLGLQLTRASFRGNLTIASVATGLRLVGGAVIGIALADALGLQTITRQTVVIESGMPSAIFGVALAHEFDTAPELITVIISLSTLASMFTLTVLLAMV
ncbi:MAG: AEC family transporter [Chloroflexi bacterium]|nr:AEC family transporter [Chloroflexota bacterium]